MGWLIPKAFNVLEHSFPMVNDPWDATKPRPSSLQYFTRRKVRTLERAASVRYLWSNYYHFFFDTLPQFRVLDAMGVPRDVPVLVPEYVPHVRFVREFLELSDFLAGRELIVQPRTEYVKVLRHTYVAKETCYSSAVFDVVSSLKPHLHAEKTDARVFVWRDPRGSRALTNDSEIAGIAKGHGFQVVDGARTSLREQISLFASARLVVGVHGAGLTNIIFRNRRPLTLLEIFPRDNTPEFYNHVCIQFGYEYDRVLGGPLDSRRHFYLDPTVFEAALVATTSRAFRDETEAV
jgi:capsular polysaccharide biosynthesis protein